jgi:hypothetical protein
LNLKIVHTEREREREMCMVGNLKDYIGRKGERERERSESKESSSVVALVV